VKFCRSSSAVSRPESRDRSQQINTRLQRRRLISVAAAATGRYRALSRRRYVFLNWLLPTSARTTRSMHAYQISLVRMSSSVAMPRRINIKRIACGLCYDDQVQFQANLAGSICEYATVGHEARRYIISDLTYRRTSIARNINNLSPTERAPPQCSRRILYFDGVRRARGELTLK